MQSQGEEIQREIAGALAAGIFRGEGNVRCLVGKRPRINPQFGAGVEMCDKKSVEMVAREWGSNVRRASGKCSCGERTWRTSIGGIDRVRNAFGKWLASGWLTGEKADQYFAAVAKCRRAREIFLKPARGKYHRQMI
jgi:hypothetical protein